MTKVLCSYVICLWIILYGQQTRAQLLSQNDRDTVNCNDLLLRTCSPQEAPDFNLCICNPCKDVCNPNYYLAGCAYQQSIGRCSNFPNGISQPELVRLVHNQQPQPNNAPQELKKNLNDETGGQKQSYDKSSKTEPSLNKDLLITKSQANITPPVPHLQVLWFST